MTGGPSDGHPNRAVRRRHRRALLSTKRSLSHGIGFRALPQPDGRFGRYKEWRADLERCDRGTAGADCPTRRHAQIVHHRAGGSRACQGAGSRCGTEARPVAWAAAWRADRGEGSVLHQLRGDLRRHVHSQGFRAAAHRDRGRAAGAGGRDPARQAHHDRGRLRDASPEDADADQPVEQGRLDGRLVERVGCGNRGWALLCVARLGHRRVDPLPVLWLRADRFEADMGPGQPPWHLSSVRIARPYRADDAHGR